MVGALGATGTKRKKFRVHGRVRGGREEADWCCSVGVVFLVTRVRGVQTIRESPSE